MLHTLKSFVRRVKSITGGPSEKKVVINGHQVRLPIVSGLCCKPSETWMTDLLKNLLSRQTGLFLDIGVNLGQTLIKVKSSDPDREYVGFEPNPACVFYLKELIARNQFPGCTIVPVGLFSEDAVLSLECINDSMTDPAASLIHDFRPGRKIYHSILVPVYRYQTLAGLLKGAKVGIVKIDVEGAELEVIKSLEPLLRLRQSVVVLEVLPVYTGEKQNLARKQRQEELERIIRDSQYLLFRVSKQDGKYVGLDAIEEIGVHSDLSRCDYVAIPNHLLDAYRGMMVQK